MECVSINTSDKRVEPGRNGTTLLLLFEKKFTKGLWTGRTNLFRFLHRFNLKIAMSLFSNRKLFFWIGESRYILLEAGHCRFSP